MSRERSEAARRFIKEIVEKDFKKVEVAAAKKFGVSQSHLHDFLAGNSGLGPKLLERVADYAKVSLDAVVGRGYGEDIEAIPPAEKAVLVVRWSNDPAVRAAFNRVIAAPNRPIEATTEVGEEIREVKTAAKQEEDETPHKKRKAAG